MSLLLLGLMAGIAVLVVSADRLVNAAGRIGATTGVSPIVIGAVLVGFGTSLPETVVSALAVLDGQIDVAIGNVVGSNVANLLLVLGAAAVIAPTSIPGSALRKELPLSLGAVLLFAVAMQRVGWAAASLLATAAVVAVWLMISGDADADEFEALPEGTSLRGETAKALLSLAVLVGSSQLALSSALGLADALGLSSGVVGAIILAVGTSLPELAASVRAARQGSHGLIVGTLLGSNIMNSTVIGAVIAGLGGHRALVPSAAMSTTSVQVMLAAVAFATVIMLTRRVSRASGGALLASYGVAATTLVQAG